MDFANVLGHPNSGMERIVPTLPSYGGGFSTNLLQQPLTPRETSTKSNVELNASNQAATRLAKIMAFSPEWDYIEGGTNIIITGPDFKKAATYYCMFDQTEVPAEILQDGAIRCEVPRRSTAGSVSFCVTRGNFMLFSEIKTFEYKTRPSIMGGTSLDASGMKARLFERLEHLERYSQKSGRSPFPQNTIDDLVKTLSNSYVSDEHLEQTCLKLVDGFFEAVDSKGVVNAQDKDGFTLLHCAAFLQFISLAGQLLQFGADTNILDNAGTTAFFYAVKNRD